MELSALEADLNSYPPPAQREEGEESPLYQPSSPPYQPSSPPYQPSSPAGSYVPLSPRSPPGSAPRTPIAAGASAGAAGGQMEKKQKREPNPATIMSRKILSTYFSSFDYPFTRHQIDSYDQFLTQDINAIIKSNNPFLLIKQEPKLKLSYRIEIYVGGLDGSNIKIGTPSITLQKGSDIRLLFPNEARLRNLSYASTVYADVIVKITITPDGEEETEPIFKEYKEMPLFQIPIMLHSRFCALHGKPASFLQEAGECTKDQGGYFVVDGSEKVLVTRQEQAFNTLYITPQPNDDKVETFANISCLSPITRQVKMVGFYWMRKTETLQVSLPFVGKPIPIFLLFRAMGVQADQDIFELIYPDFKSSEAKQMMPLLLPSIAEAFPFLDQYSAIQYIKSLTKGFSEYSVYDILFNQTFIHITDTKQGSRVHYLAECVRKFMRTHTGIDSKTDRDDIRNQRCLTSGFLIRMLFAKAYGNWKKAVRLSIDKEYSYNKSIYEREKFVNIFSEGNTAKIFNLLLITEEIMRGFKGKWDVGGGPSGEKDGVLQSLSRLSYLDFMSHCRRVHLNFDTGMKLTGPRFLHGSQYGFFCTNETPGGSSIGISKNLSLMTLISGASDPNPLTRCLFKRGWVIPCSDMRTDILQIAIPVFINNGIIGYTLKPFELERVLKLMKWTGCLPALSSIGYSIRNRRIFVFLDEGRPLRPLIHLREGGVYDKERLETNKSWRDLVVGTYEKTRQIGISTAEFIDPLEEIDGPVPLTRYEEELSPHIGLIEYIDPYEQNEAFIVNFPDHIQQESTHLEIHPSTIVSIVNGMVPFANFNQSPRNQLSCSQSKQGLSLYATNFQNRFDNNANILCYGEAPLVRTMAYDILGDGQMPYGHNLVMAIMPFHGYNQDDGIIFNYDSFLRGMFRNITYRSYETFEEKDSVSKSETIIANPLRVPQWTDLKPGKDYTKLDERGIVKIGEYVDENTIIVGKFMQDKQGKVKDASLTPQVWTSGRVESVVVTVNNLGKLLVRVRVTQDRVPELGDKFSTRHGQKGTIGMFYREHDLPRTASGVVPDMLVNPHCIPSRMTMAQLMEMLFGKFCNENSMIGDATIFMSDASAPEMIGDQLEQLGLERGGNEILYDGATGTQMPTSIFMGPVYVMRLKHMVEDKWNARGEGKKEQKTHQPTGGRGKQGGLRIGEMERDALAGHGISSFLKESIMERSDKTVIRVCNGCGTIPIYNDQQKLLICSLCDGPVRYIGNTAKTLEIIPTTERSIVTTSFIEVPYATKLLADELQAFLNMGMRFVTGKGVIALKHTELEETLEGEALKNALTQPLPLRIMPETRVPQYKEAQEMVKPAEEDLLALGLVSTKDQMEEEDFADAEALAREQVAAMQGAAFSYPSSSSSYGGGATAPFGGGATAPSNPYMVQGGGTTSAYGPGAVYGSSASYPYGYGGGGGYPLPAAAYTPPGGGATTPEYIPSSPGYAPASPAYGASSPGVALATPGTTPPFGAGGASFGGALPPQQALMATAIPAGQPGQTGQPQYLQSGGGHPIINISTAPATMAPEQIQDQMMAARGISVMGGGRRNHTTPRVNKRPMTAGGASLKESSNAKFTFVKTG